MVAANQADRRRRQARHAHNSGKAPGEIVATVREGLSGATKYVAEQARSVSRQVKDATTGVGQAVLQTVQDEAERVYAKKKARVVSRVKGVAKVGRQAAHALHAVKADKAAEYVEEASRRVGDATGYLEDHTLTEIIEDAADVVRRNQALAVGGLFVAGFALTRFLKASASRDAEGQGQAGGELDYDETAADDQDAEQDGKDDDEDIAGEYGEDESDTEDDEDDAEREEVDDEEGADAQGEMETGDEGAEMEGDEGEEEDDSTEEAPAAHRRAGGSSRDRAKDRGRPTRR